MHAPRFIPPTVEELDSLFPGHTVHSFIAQGGMGAVYLGEQTSLERPVAIKILPREFSGDVDYVASFRSEAKAMATVSHSNLVGIFDFGSVDGMLFIIMEYIPGRALFDVANGKAVEELEAAHLIIEMSKGLAQAHKAGIIHRDIKPANVLIDDKGAPKIVDFGLAKPHGDGPEEGVIFGTPGYTAPEVITDPHAVDQKSDIYSIGAMLYELLTGILPSDPYVSPSDASGCDSRFDVIVARALQPDPALRTTDADALIKELENLVRNFEAEPAAVTPSHSGPKLVTAANSSNGVATPVRPVTPLKSSKGNGGLTVLLLLGIAGIGGYLYWEKTKEGEDPAPVKGSERLEETDSVSSSETEPNLITGGSLPAHQFCFSEGTQTLKDSVGKARILDGEGVSYKNGRALFNPSTKRAPRILVDKRTWTEAKEIAFEFWVTWREEDAHSSEEQFFSISSKQGKTKGAVKSRSISLYPNFNGAFALRVKTDKKENTKPSIKIQKDSEGKAIPFPKGGMHHVVVNVSPLEKTCKVYLDGTLTHELNTRSMDLASLSEDGVVILLGQDAYSSQPSFIGNFQQFNIHHKVLTPAQIKTNSRKALVKDSIK